MNNNDFVYMQVYKGCLSAGCIESVAKSAAVTTLQKYKNNQFTKVSTLIKNSIADAKKVNFKRNSK